MDSGLGATRLAQAMQGLTQALPVFIEIDVGQGRCGVAPGPAALALAQQIQQHPALRFAGLQAYQGQAQHLRSPQERANASARALADVRQTVALLQAHGIAVDLVSGAGTGTFGHEAQSGVYGELQAGSYLFMDADYARNQVDAAQPTFEHALFVKSQVISRQADRAVCDAGHKSHAIESGLPWVHGWHGAEALVFANGGDEHGVLRAQQPGGRLPELGETVWLIPGHCDPTVNLHNHLIGVRGGLNMGVVERVITVDARGALT